MREERKKVVRPSGRELAKGARTKRSSLGITGGASRTTSRSRLSARPTNGVI